MLNETAPVFLNECVDALGFLTEEYGFSKPEVIIDQKIYFIFVTFYKQKLAIECSYDLRDEDTSIRVEKLENGKKPDCWRINKKGEVCSEYLPELLIARGVRDLKFDPIESFSNLPKYQAEMKQSLLRDARILKKYGQDILNDSLEIFKYADPTKGDKF